jgi:hypothetical protein
MDHSGARNTFSVQDLSSCAIVNCCEQGYALIERIWFVGKPECMVRRRFASEK